MKKLLIWWHRRRAAHHAALIINGGVTSGITSDYVHLSHWHEAWRDWHFEQIVRLSK